MLILANTTDNIQVVLSGNVAANQLGCISTWVDVDATTNSPGRTVVSTNNTTDVNIVPAPASGYSRTATFISIFNSDTANATVTIKYDANGTEYTLFKCTLGVGEQIQYSKDTGFIVLSNSGSIKQSINQGNNPSSSTISTVILGSDVINNNAVANTIADVTGLSFPVTTGTYWFRFVIHYTSAATSTGSRWTINGPANSMLGYRTSLGLSAAGTSGTDVFTDVNVAAYDSPTTANASSPTSTAAQSNIATIEGIITPTADGSVIARFSSEIANSAITAKAGSIAFYQKVI